MRKLSTLILCLCISLIASAQPVSQRGVSLGLFCGFEGYGFAEKGESAHTIYGGGGLLVDGKILTDFGIRADLFAGKNIWSSLNGKPGSSQPYDFVNMSLEIAPYYEWNFNRWHLDLGGFESTRIRFANARTNAKSIYLMTLACSAGPYLCGKYDISGHLQISANLCFGITFYDKNYSTFATGYSNRFAGMGNLNIGIAWQF